MARSGVTRLTSILSKSLYYIPQHMWGLTNEVHEFTIQEVAENTWNEDDLHNVSWPIQAFSEFY